MKHRDGAGGAAKDERERRRFFRVRARLPVRHRPLEPGEFETLKREIETPRPEAEEIEPALAARLTGLEQKLDQVLALVGGGANTQPAEPLNVELSGGGMKFAAKLPEEQEGQDTLVEILLPGYPPRLVRTIARVVARSRGANGDEIAVCFRVIDERDREAIVRFAHEVERAQLRTRAAREQDG